MKKRTLKKYVKEMFKRDYQNIDSVIEKVIKANYLEIKKYEENYDLPKAFIRAYYNYLSCQYKPFSKELLKESKNIELFL